MKKQRPIGGFFELALEDDNSPHNVQSHWGLQDSAQIGFSNARSALSALLKESDPPRLFLPAYICQSVVDACVEANCAIIYYGLNDSLEPDVPFLERIAKTGDAILAVNYFGRSAGDCFITFANKHPEITFIEDCAQSFDTGQKPWGNWRLFSPRKLVGVADGGFIVHTGSGPAPYSILPDRAINPEADIIWKAALLRAEDPDGTSNDLWHSINQQREKSIKVNRQRITDLSHETLTKLNASAIASKRRSNYTTLHKQLSSIALYKNNELKGVPFGYPVRVEAERRDVLAAVLIAERIFHAIHWSTLPSPAAAFPREHSLSREILTLPCDQRYDDQDMARIAAITKKSMGLP